MSKKYKIKEIYYTLQGEGHHTGKPAVFCRFAGCNLWNGLEADRHKAICKFCDTDFWGTDGENGGSYHADELAQKIASLWPSHNEAARFVVFTGGEPLLQMDEALTESIHQEKFGIAIETNGTLEAPNGIDWICVSPKANTDIVIKRGHELKLVHPQDNIDPQDFVAWDFEYHYLQPMDSPELAQNTALCIKYCKENPTWNLSIQTHKLLNIP
jgi:7-carboxy-7-deazaguanine synthase (Cx14CxxC type)